MNTFKYNNSTVFPKIVGETRHFPPAVKEWKDSVYTYNKNYLKNLPSKDILAYKMLKYYFNLSDCKHLARSKRMRNLIRKSTNLMLVSKPELKQTNDNVGITIYTSDKERIIFLRRIYHNIRKWENKKNIQGVSINTYNSYNTWRNRYNLNKFLTRLENNNITNIFNTKNRYINTTNTKQIKNKYLSLKNIMYLKKKDSFNINRTYHLKTRSNVYKLKRKRINILLKNSASVRVTNRIKKLKNKVPYFGIKLLSEVKFLRYISQFKYSVQTRKLIYYFYMKRILSILGIKILSYNLQNYNVNNIKDSNLIKDIDINSKEKVLFLFDVQRKYLNKPELLYIDNTQKNLPYLDKVNIVLSNFVKKILNNNVLINNKNLSLASFSKINFKDLLLKENENSFSMLNKTKLDSLKKEVSLMKDYINVKINNFKFSKYLPALKLLISKLYNKNVELNIIKLKYFYLNSDIYTQAISTKLREKQSTLKILRKSLKLVETPKEFNEITNKVNNMVSLNVYKSLNLKNLFISSHIQENAVDNLDMVIKNIYPCSYINQATVKENELKTKFASSKLTNVINVVKHKWVTGVRLEIAGRLTRRYTASRSLYKCKNKGSLKNTDFSRKLDFLKKSMPVIMFRNNAKSNSQYSFAKSKKRIGAFGVKGWVSSY